MTPKAKNRVTSRRDALRLMGGTVGAVALGTLAGCGPEGDTEVSPDFAPTQVATPDELLREGDYTEAVVGGRPVMVLASAQPVAGSVARRELYLTAFSRVCKHNGCTVAAPVGTTLNCPCHGSSYSRADGSVVQGPAEEALTQYRLRVEADGSVTVTSLLRL